MDKMETTENLGLKKPSQDDYYNVDDFNYNADAIDEFCGRTDNPHDVTKEQVGLGNVPNVSTNDQIPTYTEASTLEALKSGEKLSVAFGKIAKAIKDFINHIVTKASSTVLGHVKLTDSSAVTDGTGYALPATEKNASISGTLANQIELKANLTDAFVSRGWITNGASVLNLSIGHWSCNPNALPSQGVPDGFSTYGSLHITDDPYRQIIYIDVYGNVATYGTNQGKWNALANLKLVNDSKVKSKVLTFSGVTTENTTAFFNNYKWWGYVGGGKTKIDDLIKEGHTILGGFVIGGPHNDSSLAGNITDNIGVITGSSTYYNVPYSFYVFSQGYQTVHVKVCVLYI